MNKLLPWLKEVETTQPMNIEMIDIKYIPEKPGVYIMLSHRNEYLYPKAKSQVYYIGESKNLRKRLRNHKKNC